MSGVSLPVTRPIGRALIIGSEACRSGPLLLAQQLGYQCAESDNPYAAMAELCRRPLVYRSVILSLASIFKEELALISSIKRRFPHVEIWLAHTDGRAAALAEASRLGADGLLADNGLHRFALTNPAPAVTRVPPTAAVDPGPPPQRAAPQPGLHASQAKAAPPQRVEIDDEPAAGEPVLTADELRALLQDQPSRSPGPEED